jgi:hypothetical protein
LWLNIVGLKTGKWLQNLGALGTYIPGAVLVGFGLHAMLTRAAATPITWATVRPHVGDMSQINLWPRSHLPMPAWSSVPSWAER